ncbi:MAG: hypothetical protein O2856_18465, partial [Planctomycetota bacterium]|nr:hypothetical protein [Planctomycetota bacterium]
MPRPTRFFKSLLLIVFLNAGIYSDLWARQNDASDAKTGVQFDLDALSKTPEVFPAENIQVDGVKTFYFAGPKYKGRPTRVFAYYGVPAQPAVNAENQRRPAMVLIH